jgi:hypothetical protein
MLERKIQTHFADVAPLDMPEHGVKMALFITLSRFMFSNVSNTISPMQDEDAKIKFLIALGHLWREKDLNETPKRLFEDEYFVSVDTVKLHIEEIFECVPSDCQKMFSDNLTTELCYSHSHISACLNYLKDCETVGPDHGEYSETSWPLLESFPARRHCRNHDFGDWLCDSHQLQHFVGGLYRHGSIVWAQYYSDGVGLARREAISEADEDEYEEQTEALEYVNRLSDLRQEVEVEDEVEDEVEENNAEYDLSAQQDEEFAPESEDECDEDDEDYNDAEGEESEDEGEESEDDVEFVSELDLAEISSIGTIDDNNTDDELEYTISPNIFDD